MYSYLQCEIHRDRSQFISDDWYMYLSAHFNLFCLLFLNCIHLLFELLLLSHFDDFFDPQMLSYILNLFMKFFAFILFFQFLFGFWQRNRLRDRFILYLEVLILPLVTNLAFILRA